MKQRVLVLTDQDLQMPGSLSPESLSPESLSPKSLSNASLDKLDERWSAQWKTEYDVLCALEKLGHETRVLGAVTDLKPVRDLIAEWQPAIIFNLLESLFGENFYVPYLLGYFELIGQAFTGCNPSGLFFAYNKPLMKKVLHFHRIPIPQFKVFPMGKAARRPRNLSYPLIVKSTSEHGSEGIAQASVVTADDKLKERVEFIHSKLRTDAMAEQYIEGRELYVGVIGNQRLESFPVWEFQFGNLPEGSQAIATSKMKWDSKYREKIGITSGAAKDLPPGFESLMSKLCKRIYSILGLCGYARLDFRLTADGKIYLIEPNPNPDLGRNEDFSESARAVGISYEDLIQRVLTLGLKYQTAR